MQTQKQSRYVQNVIAMKYPEKDDVPTASGKGTAPVLHRLHRGSKVDVVKTEPPPQSLLCRQITRPLICDQTGPRLLFLENVLTSVVSFKTISVGGMLCSEIFLNGS